MDSAIVKDEINVLRSVYCQDGEFILHVGGNSEVSYSLLVGSSNSVMGNIYQMNVVVTKDYPDELPTISVQCSALSRRQLETVEHNLRAEAEKLVGLPMILELANTLSQQCTSPKQLSASSETDQVVSFVTVILSVDHIRSRAQYCKVLSRWFDDLDLNAALLFLKHDIFLIVSGIKHSIQAYLKNHRTQNIDVDSNGRPCKERLLTVLGEENCRIVFEERFKIVDFKTYEQLGEFMEEQKLTRLYDTYIKPCVY